MGKGGQRPPSDADKGLIASEYGWAEITKHRSPADAWLMINNKIYDVSGWHEHPGGDVIFTSAGDDATDTFALFHANGTSKHLSKFLIGSLKQDDRANWPDLREKGQDQLDFEKGYRRLKMEMRRDGLFDSSLLYYIYKMSTTLMICLFSAWLVAAHSEDTMNHFAARCWGGILMGIFFQQSGWLCHEICHHQCFKNRIHGKFLGYFWGNCAQGFSVAWWTNKHCTHHAVPNVHGDEGCQNGDPDIDTMPLLAWSRSMLAKATTPLSKKLVKHQALTYFPLLSVARLSWLQQSLAYVFPAFDTDGSRGGRIIKGSNPPMAMPIPYEWMERLSLVLHYVWYFAVAYSAPSLTDALLYVVLSNVSCGLSLALVFGLGHNGMAVYDAAHRPDYWKLQVTTTRNVTQDALGFVHWFCGGLDYQVEHHLFPTMPRHHLAECNRRVRKFCKDYGVTYHETTMWQGTLEVLEHLQDIANEVIEDFPAM